MRKQLIYDDAGQESRHAGNENQGANWQRDFFRQWHSMGLTPKNRLRGMSASNAVAEVQFAASTSSTYACWRRSNSKMQHRSFKHALKIGHDGQLAYEQPGVLSWMRTYCYRYMKENSSANQLRPRLTQKGQIEKKALAALRQLGMIQQRRRLQRERRVLKSIDMYFAT